jgi:tetratricopeptide (TPR) repeat protein
MVMWSGPRVHSAGFGTGITIWTYLLNQTVMIVQYLKLAFWPQQLVVHYGFPRPLTLGDVWWQAAVVAALLSMAVALWIRRPRLGFFFAWFFVTLAPTSSIVPIAMEVGAERRMYLPLLGVIVLVLIAVEQLAQWQAASDGRAMSSPSCARTIGHITLAAVTIALVARTITRNREYQQPLTLATTVLDRWPTGLAHHWVGSELLRAQRPTEAVRHLRLAVPDAPRALFTLGVELLHEGQNEEAIRELREFIRREPVLLEVPMAHAHIGRALGGLQRWNEAADEARVALKMIPGLADAQALLAEALFEQEMMPEAIDAYRVYLRLKPDDLNALGNLGIALAATGRLPDALNVFRRTTVLAPGNGGAWRNLATALLEATRFDEAADAARSAIDSHPNDPVAFALLAQALARGGHWQDAREALQRGLRLDPGNSALRAHLGRLLAAAPRTER